MNEDNNTVELSGFIDSGIHCCKTRKNIPVSKCIIKNTREKSTHYFNVTAYGKNATRLKSYEKGDYASIIGHLQQEKWVSKDTGKKISKITIIIDDFE